MLISRRTFWESVVSVLIFTSLDLALAADVLVSQVKTISHQSHLYHGWSTVAQRKGGELILVYSGGRQKHVCPFGRVELMRSKDGGETWSWPRVILDGPIDDRDAGVCITKSGAILVTTFTSLAYQPYLEKMEKNGTLPKGWKEAHERVGKEARNKELGQWLIRSEDGGVNWSERIPTLANSPHGPVQLSDGRLLYPGKELWTGERRVGFSVSNDDGRTWRWQADLPVREGDQASNYHELYMVECNSQRLVVHLRNHNPKNKGETLQSESNDGGKTWTVPHSIGVWGLPSHLIKLTDGRLLMSYGYRRKPFGIRTRVSGDEGRSWSEPLTITEDGIGSDLGYPTTVELAPSELITIWYETPRSGGSAQLRQAKWSFK